MCRFWQYIDFTIQNALNYYNYYRKLLYIDWSDGQFGTKNKNVFNDNLVVKHPSNVIDAVAFSSISFTIFIQKHGKKLYKIIYDLYNVGEPNFF